MVVFDVAADCCKGLDQTANATVCLRLVIPYLTESIVCLNGASVKIRN